MALDDDLSLARDLAARAGAILREGAFRAHHSDKKRTAVDLVTAYDKKSERLIVEGLRATGDRIVAEEGGVTDGGGGRRWLVDPLDGTTNFAHGLPFFVVSIGLEIDGALA